MEVDRDGWLSGTLGHDVFRVRLPAEPPSRHDLPKRDDAIAGFAEGQSALFYTKVPTARVDYVEAMTAIGFYVVDVNITFERETTPTVETDTAGGLEVRDCPDSAYGAVLDIAASCFRYSRFHLDPHIPDESANAVKRAWIDSYIRGERGERLLACFVDGRPVGFLAVLAGGLGDKRIYVIDLIGVDSAYCGRGLGRRLTSHFVNAYAGECDLYRVGTQAANLPSIRLYEGSGFRAVETSYVLHAHTRKGRFLR